MADHDLSLPKSGNSNENMSVHPREVVMAGEGGSGGLGDLSCVLLPLTVDCCACLDKSGPGSRWIFFMSRQTRWPRDRQLPPSSVSIHLMVELQLRVFYKYIHKYFHKRHRWLPRGGDGMARGLCGEVSQRRHLDTPTCEDPHQRDKGETLSLRQRPAHIHKRDLGA